MRRNIKPGRFAWPCCAALVMTMGVATIAGAQTPPAAPAESKPLARFAPRDNVALYLEFAGLDAFDDAWRKTAAFKMLNETTLGVMLEDLVAQLADKSLSRGDRKFTGTELVTIIKHLARNGVLFAMTGVGADVKDPDKDGAGVIVLKGGAKKEVRPLFSRFMLSVDRGKSKAELSKRPEGRSVVLMTDPATKKRWAWWAEGEDLVISMNAERSLDTITAILDGKIPSAVELPARTDLFKPENGFQPVLVAFSDFNRWPEVAASATFAAKAHLQGVERLDYRSGFSGDALMTITRIKSPKPRQGILALLDQPTFGPTALPALPEGINSFSVVSVNLPKAYDIIKGLGPGIASALDRAQDTLRSKARLQLRKDVLAHLGPKMAFYVVPAPASASKSAAERVAGLQGALSGTNPMALLTAMPQIPRFTLISEVSDPVNFGKSVDSLMIFANQQLRTIATPPHTPDDAEGGRPGAGGDRRSREPVQAPEFKMMLGDHRSYMLSIPSSMGKLPQGVRPTIRLGSKDVAIAIAPDVARQALEVKKGEGWAPPPEVATAFEQLPSSLIFLNVSDPRDTTPELLASLPGRLQAGINAGIAQAMARNAAAANANPGLNPGNTPGGAPDAAMGPGGAGIRPPAMAGPGMAGAGMRPPGPPGSRPNAPGQPGAPGGGGNKAGEGNANSGLAFIEIQVDPAKLPSVEALKGFLFPATSAVSTTDQGVEFISRAAFPSLVMPTSSAALAYVLPMVQKSAAGAVPDAGGAAPGAPNAGKPANPSGGPNSSPPPSGDPRRGRRRSD